MAWGFYSKKIWGGKFDDQKMFQNTWVKTPIGAKRKFANSCFNKIYIYYIEHLFDCNFQLHQQEGERSSFQT